MSIPFNNIFEKISSLRVGVVGDFAVDAYYPLETKTGEISLETGKAVHRGGKIRTSLGAAGNVVNNFRALNVTTIRVFGIRADDLWGRELIHLLHQKNVDTSGLLIQEENWQSCAYVKPMQGKEESNRLDFGSYNQANDTLLDEVLENIKASLPELDILLLNQQFVNPLLNAEMVGELNELSRQNSHCLFLADLRNLGQHVRHMILKANTAETIKLLGLSQLDERNTADCIDKTRVLSTQHNCPVLLTRGPFGMIFSDKKTTDSIQGIWHDGEVDSVGAGDTGVSTFAACKAAGATNEECLKIANAASAVTVRKLFQTGTASPQEVQEILDDSSYVYHPHLASHPESAQYYQDTYIEVIEDFEPKVRIKYAMFDHDGTISVLRQGWEDIMEPLMLKSISGKSYTQLTVELKDELQEKISQLISQTTGAPTIVQMEGLVDLIRREGYISNEEILTPEDYKQQFLTLLNDKVEERLDRFQQNELSIEDFTMKGVMLFMQMLQTVSVELILASGTDEKNVIQEANSLGYGPWFKGGIHGARPDGESAKRKVLRYLIEKKKADPAEIVVIGDGPSEIREGRKMGALCIGIASDEVRRYGLNTSKRERLIRAGAHYIIADFSQGEVLFDYIFSQPTQQTEP